METIKPQEIAKHIGVDAKRVRGTQDWRPDTHPHLTISEIVLHPAKEGDEPEIHPFRVRDESTGLIHTRLEPERGNFDHSLDHEKVKSVHAETLALNRKKNLEVMPAIFEAVPELNPEPETSARFLRLGDKVYDLVDGKLLNPRVPPELPGVVHDGRGFVIDASRMADHHQKTIAMALGKKHRVIAPRAGG